MISAGPETGAAIPTPDLKYNHKQWERPGELKSSQPEYSRHIRALIAETVKGNKADIVVRSQ